MMDELELTYLEISRPSVLLKSESEVIEFLTGATKEDIDAFIAACIDDEAYEWAAIAKNHFVNNS